MPEEAKIIKNPPHDESAEQAVLGSMLMDAAALSTGAENLHPEDFFIARNGYIFEALASLAFEKKPADLVTLKSRLELKGHADVASDIKYLTEIASAVPSSAHIKHYVAIVKEKAVYRRFIDLGNNILSRSYSGTSTVDELTDSAEKGIYDIMRDRGGTDFIYITDPLRESMNNISLASENGGPISGVPTGFIDLDKLIHGLMPASLVLVGARPSMGKTAFGLNVATNLALKQQKSVAIFSLEMPATQIATRILASVAGVDLTKMTTGDLSDDDWDALMNAYGEINQTKIYIDENPGIRPMEMLSKCRKLQLERGLDFVMVDYLQLMESDLSHGDNRQQEVSEISRAMKRMARELDIPVMALSQLSRSLESRADHRPMMSDLRESGAIEQDADVIMFLYRDEYYHEDSEKRGIAEVIVAKNRNGMVGTKELRYDGCYTRFSNLDSGY